jgi:hypothetical protein
VYIIVPGWMSAVAAGAHALVTDAPAFAVAGGAEAIAVARTALVSTADAPARRRADVDVATLMWAVPSPCGVPSVGRRAVADRGNNEEAPAGLRPRGLPQRRYDVRTGVDPVSIRGQ